MNLESPYNFEHTMLIGSCESQSVVAMYIPPTPEEGLVYMRLVGMIEILFALVIILFAAWLWRGSAPSGKKVAQNET